MGLNGETLQWKHDSKLANGNWELKFLSPNSNQNMKIKDLGPINTSSYFLSFSLESMVNIGKIIVITYL